MSDFRVHMGIGLQWTPWRVPDENFRWSKDTADQLRKQIVETLPTEKSGVEQLRVLIIGPKGHGKSSLINSFASISAKTKVTVCNAAEMKSNVTTVYRSYEFPGDLQQLRVCDVTGLSKEKYKATKPFLEDIELVIKGKIKNGYQFDPKKSISPENDHYVAEPKVSDKIHCVVIALDCTEVYDIHQYYLDSLMTTLSTINMLNVPVIVVLTKADKHSEHVKHDIKTLFRCKSIRDAVHNASVKLTIPDPKIFPVVNVEVKDIYKKKEAIPILLAMRSCLLMAKIHAHNYK